MQQFETWQRREVPGLLTPGLTRWLVLLLLLTFSMSGLVHVPTGDNAASAASFSHDVASVSQDTGGQPCCTEHDGQPQGTTCSDTTCSMASGCSFSVVLTPVSASMTRLGADTLETWSEDVHLSRAPNTQFRPPKLSANV